jgi:glycosyltransferase involved in cell wall biosynthesis
MARFVLLGPTYPFRGGIAHYTTLLAQHLREKHDTLLISFLRQYPRWLFPGRSDRDPSHQPLITEAEYLLDPLNPATWRRALRRIGEWQPDGVIMQWWHPFWAPAWSILARGVKRLPGRPRLIVICHNILPHEQGIARPLLALISRWALSPADAFVVHAAADGAMLAGMLPQARYQVTPHPTYAALGDLSPAELPIPLPADRPLLLFAGFVRPYKGLDILLEAMGLAVTQRPLHLLVAGEFWQGVATYNEQIERLKLVDAVTIIDTYLPNELLAACLNRADLVVLPYRSATQSGIIQAAFGQNKPVITTSVGGLAEVVTHERTGLVIPPSNPLALAAAIERFFAEDLGPLFAENIAGDNDRFSWRHLAAQIETMCLQND